MRRSRSATLLCLATAAVPAAAQASLEAARGQGLLPYLGICLTGGLVSLVTPCVFPMIPVTVSYFAKRSEGKAMAQASAYALGIVATFAVLGIVVSVLFGATGLASFATNPWVNLGLAALFVALALNLFGVFEITLPSALARKTDQQRTRQGLAGPFFMGMTFSLTSFTCTAPIAGTLLATAAAKGDLVYPTLGMAAYGLAFAVPFFLLALFPSSLNRMPRAGDWLTVVKPALAFVELAAAVKFFSNADLGFQLGWITRPVFLMAWVAIFGLLAFYLLGIPRAAQKVGVSRRALGGVTLGFAFLLAMGLRGWPLGVIESFPPPDPYPARSGIVADKAPQTQLVEGRLQANTFDQALKVARETGRSVFVDFTGVTCVNCRLMEKRVFPQPDVKKRLDKMVYVQLYTDRPTAEDAANKKLQDQLAKNIALPTYVLVRPDGRVIDKYEGLSPTVEEFVRFLDKANA